jgi:hypothetical protein
MMKPIRRKTEMQKTYEKVFEFMGETGAWISQNPELTKFKYGLEREMKLLKNVKENFEIEANDISIDNAATDDKGVLLTDANGAFKFTKEGLKARNKQHRELLSKSVEIEPYYVSEIPDELTDEQRQAFTGFVIRETPETPA